MSPVGIDSTVVGAAVVELGASDAGDSVSCSSLAL